MDDCNGKLVRFSIPSNPSMLGDVRLRIDQFVSEIGFDEKCTAGIILAVDEALTNIIRHAYDGDKDKPIDVEMSFDSGVLSISLRDYGLVVEPENIQGRELDDIRPGGLGVHIIRDCMDSVEYLPAEGCGTRLVMKRSLPAPDEANTKE